jgi:hypothetical protein
MQGVFSELRQDEERGSIKHITDKIQGPGLLLPGPWCCLRTEGLVLRVGPYLAVDLLDEGLTILVALLLLADLLELLVGEPDEPLGDLFDAQPIVVRGLQSAEDGGP